MQGAGSKNHASLNPHFLQLATLLSLISDAIQIVPPLTPQVVRAGQPQQQQFTGASPPGSFQGWEYYSTNEGRIQLVGGRLRMDDSVGNTTSSLNEAVLHVDLLDQSNVQLSVDRWSLGDEVHALPTTFAGHANGDGIAVSSNGTNW